ncbi:MAG: hypothetical protein QOG15_986 [Solirubrobacteraceae bacterium]|jgi:hypothetical protein|nr:hypothetical protein [Solirubrobacteraceae bacterium]
MRDQRPWPISEPVPRGRRGEIAAAHPLPVEGCVEVAMSVERLWEVFLDVPAWSQWNPCIWRATVRGGELREGAKLVWAFNPIRPLYLYKLPAVAEIVELFAHQRVTWEVSAPGFHALHSYRFAELDSGCCRFGSWEVAEGPAFHALRRFWLAHFRFVCDESLAGARDLGPRPPVTGTGDRRARSG